MWDFINQPLIGTSSLILIAVLGAVIFVAIKLGHKKRERSPNSFCQSIPMRPHCIFMARICPLTVPNWIAFKAQSPRCTIPGRSLILRCKRVWPAMYYPEQ